MENTVKGGTLSLKKKNIYFKKGETASLELKPNWLIIHISCFRRLA